MLKVEVSYDFLIWISIEWIVLAVKEMWWKKVSKVRFGEKFHKSITLFLEQTSHKYLEMGMNGGGVNQEGDNSEGGGLGGGPCWRGTNTLGAAVKTKGKAAKKGGEWHGWAEVGFSPLQRKKRDQRERLKPIKGRDIKERSNIKPRNKRP